MSKIMTHIIEQEEAGLLEYNEEIRQYEPTTRSQDTTECFRCLQQTAEPIETPDGEAICQTCYEQVAELTHLIDKLGESLSPEFYEHQAKTERLMDSMRAKP